MVSFIDIAERIRSLGFGGALGSGLAGLVYLLSPSLFQGVDIETVLLVGWFLGSGFHRFLNSLITGSAGMTANSLFKLAKLNYYVRRNWLSETDAKNLRKTIITRDLLGEKPEDEYLITKKEEPSRLIEPNGG